MALPERGRITVHRNVVSVNPQAGRVFWNTDRFHEGTFDAVILAVGFGLEREIAEVPWISYWHNDSLHQVSFKGSARHLISGCGDGGLTDLLRIRLRNFKHEEVSSLLALVPDNIQSDLLAIEEEAGTDRDPAAVLQTRVSPFSGAVRRPVPGSTSWS
jgi:hypothetical protein